MKKNFSFPFSLLVGILLSACQTAPAEEDPIIPPVNVSVWSLDQRPSYTLKEVGIVKPFQEVEVVAKTGGILEKLNVKLGQEVTAGQVLGELDASNKELAEINLLNAKNQLANAERNYDESVANGQNSANQAKLRAKNLETTLARLQRNLRELQGLNEINETRNDYQIENAELALNGGEESRRHLESGFDQSWEDFFKNTELNLDTLLVHAEGYEQSANNILNPQGKDRLEKEDFSDLLGSKNNNQRNQTIQLYNRFRAELKNSQDAYEDFLPLNERNLNEAFDAFVELTQAGRDLNQALRTLLNNSQSGPELPENVLAGYKSQIAAAEASSLQDIALLNGINSAYQKLYLEESNQLSGIENNLDVLANQQAGAELSLDQLQISGPGAEKDLQAQIEATRNDLESAYLEYENALRSVGMQNSAKDLEIATYKNQVKLAEQTLKDSQILAPIRGTVTELFVDEGDNLNPGSAILKINQQAQLKVEFFVTEEQANWLEEGQQVFAQQNNTDNVRLSGRLLQIGPNADPQSRKVKIEAAFDKENLRPEMLVIIEAEVGEKAFNSSSLYVPLNSVIFGQNEQYVFIATPEKVSAKVFVELGQVLDKWVEVTSGLNSQDELIVEGQRRLEEGRELEIEKYQGYDF